MPPRQPFKAVTPASVFIGPVLIALGLLFMSGGGEVGLLVALVGIVVTIFGLAVRSRRRRDALAFNIQMLLHEADDPDD